MADNHSVVRIGVIGCGRVVEEFHLPTLTALPEIGVATIADLDEERLHKVGSKFEIPKRYCDYKSLLNSCTVDVIAVCIPTQFHRAVTLAALRPESTYLSKRLSRSVWRIATR